jgi:hypothetical protein
MKCSGFCLIQTQGSDSDQEIVLQAACSMLRTILQNPWIFLMTQHKRSRRPVLRLVGQAIVGNLPKSATPIAGWFRMETHNQNGWFRGTPVLGNLHTATSNHSLERMKWSSGCIYLHIVIVCLRGMESWMPQQGSALQSLVPAIAHQLYQDLAVNRYHDADDWVQICMHRGVVPVSITFQFLGSSTLR